VSGAVMGIKPLPPCVAEQAPASLGRPRRPSLRSGRPVKAVRSAEGCNGAARSPQVGDNLGRAPYPTDEAGRKPCIAGESPRVPARAAHRRKAPRVRRIPVLFAENRVKRPSAPGGSGLRKRTGPSGPGRTGGMRASGSRRFVRDRWPARAGRCGGHTSPTLLVSNRGSRACAAGSTETFHPASAGRRRAASESPAGAPAVP